MEAQLTIFSLDCQTLLKEYKSKIKIYKYLGDIYTLSILLYSSTIGVMSVVECYNPLAIPDVYKYYYVLPLSWIIAIISVFNVFINFASTSILYQNAFWGIVAIIDNIDAAAPLFKTNSDIQNTATLLSLRKQKLLIMAKLGTYDIKKYIKADEIEIESYGTMTSSSTSNGDSAPLIGNKHSFKTSNNCEEYV